MGTARLLCFLQSVLDWKSLFSRLFAQLLQFSLTVPHVDDFKSRVQISSKRRLGMTNWYRAQPSTDSPYSRSFGMYLDSCDERDLAIIDTFCWGDWTCREWMSSARPSILLAVGRLLYVWLTVFHPQWSCMKNGRPAHLPAASWRTPCLCWEKRLCPQDMRDATIITLYKSKGDSRDCNNYRGISHLSIVGKYSLVLPWIVCIVLPHVSTPSHSTGSDLAGQQLTWSFHCDKSKRPVIGPSPSPLISKRRPREVARLNEIRRD